ncbi:RNA-binding protein 48 isoform X2 [Toxorhynchites rutilus septentrionalis]|uniref:RNA-binding protein 48 isoform X2 n=1 Tax=Toxorhynchites rutilus septentrionalis TaxID=329112 RepID=UPI00247B1E83|nr:RNA-binding protein 48 isoform X2 [Toxorhynchites rutilus septentrionalis]
MSTKCKQKNILRNQHSYAPYIKYLGWQTLLLRMSIDPVGNSDLSHHVRFNYCHNRPAYRKSRKLTAVKTYSVACESCHLLVFGVPQINLLRELKSELCRHGSVELIQNVTESIRAAGNKIEPFTDVFHVKFEKIEKARRAKKIVDAKNFYGGILHISYAPERETIEELRHKLYQRKGEIEYRVQRNRQQEQQTTLNKNSVLPNSSSLPPSKRFRAV